MSDAPQALQSRHVWWIARDRIGDEQQIAGSTDVAIRPSPRPAYDTIRELLPVSTGLVHAVSPARRAQQTAARLLPNVVWDADELLGPRRFGAWDGLTWADIRADDPKRCENYWTDNALPRPPGDAESMRDVAERVDAWLTSALHRPGWRHIVVVTHAELIRAALCNVVEIPMKNALRVAVDPLSVTHLSHSWMGWQVHAVNRKP